MYVDKIQRRASLKPVSTLAVFSSLLTLILTSCLPPIGFWEAPRAVKDFSAGNRHTVAVGTDGALWAWGRNDGQIGDGSITSRNRPVRIGSAMNWELVSAGPLHTVAIRNDGTLWAWGNNQHGQLGDGTTISRNSPVRIGSADNWYFVSAGDSHTIAIRRDRSLWAWGNNQHGQLGIIPAMGHSTHPVQVGTASNWRSVSTGERHTVAIRTDGTLWAWGNNQYGQLGNGTTIPHNSPMQIGSATNWRSVSAGPRHTMAIREDGTLWGWGHNQHRQLGDNTTQPQRNSPVQIGSATNWKYVSAGHSHTMAITTDGWLLGWGNNQYGQLGIGWTSAPRPTPERVAVGMTQNWLSVSAGNNYTTASRQGGSLWAWGQNWDGQLGDGTTTQRNHPTQITR